MKTLLSRYIYTVFFLFSGAVVFSQPIPPGELPVDENIWILIIAALIFGIYIIYVYRFKKEPA